MLAAPWESKHLTSCVGSASNEKKAQQNTISMRSAAAHGAASPLVAHVRAWRACARNPPATPAPSARSLRGPPPHTRMRGRVRSVRAVPFSQTSWPGWEQTDLNILPRPVLVQGFEFTCISFTGCASDLRLAATELEGPLCFSETQ
jgi:hypothetical protein